MTMFMCPYHKVVVGPLTGMFDEPCSEEPQGWLECPLNKYLIFLKCYRNVIGGSYLGSVINISQEERRRCFRTTSPIPPAFNEPLSNYIEQNNEVKKEPKFYKFLNFLNVQVFLDLFFLEHYFNTFELPPLLLLLLEKLRSGICFHSFSRFKCLNISNPGLLILNMDRSSFDFYSFKLNLIDHLGRNGFLKDIDYAKDLEISDVNSHFKPYSVSSINGGRNSISLTNICPRIVESYINRVDIRYKDQFIQILIINKSDHFNSVTISLYSNISDFRRCIRGYHDLSFYLQTKKTFISLPCEFISFLNSDGLKQNNINKAILQHISVKTILSSISPYLTYITDSDHDGTYHDLICFERFYDTSSWGNYSEVSPRNHDQLGDIHLYPISPRDVSQSNTLSLTPSLLQSLDDEFINSN